MIGQLLNFSLNGIAFYGLALVIYGFIKEFRGQSYKPIEAVVPLLSFIVVIIATIWACIMIYIDIQLGQPAKLSLFFTAPMVIIGSIFTIVVSIIKRKVPDTTILLGFSLISIAASIIRFFPFKYE